MARRRDKIPLIIAMIEQGIYSNTRKLDYAVVSKDWHKAAMCQARIETATELLEVVKTLNDSKEREQCSQKQ